jgi:hypothetical protein
MPIGARLVLETTMTSDVLPAESVIRSTRQKLLRRSIRESADELPDVGPPAMPFWAMAMIVGCTYAGLFLLLSAML